MMDSDTAMFEFLPTSKQGNGGWHISGDEWHVHTR